ncbi:MAG: O-antigen/teichoic acid export membrane protein [Pseudohongiellaceae bacterium]|jgi:O-antigen/teichoic acid export membrane protein
MLAAVVYGVLLLAVGFMDLAPVALAAARILGLCFMLGQLGLSFASFLNGMEMARIPAFALVVEKYLLTGGCVALLLSGYGLVAVAWMHVIAVAGSLTCLAWRTYRLVPFRLGITREQGKSLLKGASPFLVWLIFGEIYVRIDVLMLASMTGEDMVGWYGAAFRLYATLLFIPNLFMTTVVPALTRKFASEGESAGVASRRTLNFMLLVSVWHSWLDPR